MLIDITPRYRTVWIAGVAATLAAIAVSCAARSSELPLRQVGADIPLPGMANRFDYATVDPQRHLLFLAHLGSGMVTAIDLRTTRVAGDPDVLAFDPGLRRLYVASESGVVAVFELEGKDLRLLGRKLLAHEAHSVAVDPATHRVYFPLQNIRGRGVLRVMAPTAMSQTATP